MQEAEIASLLRGAMVVTLKLGGPPLLVALCTGLLVSLLQTVTQLNEATLAFVPKALAVSALLLVMGPFMLTTLIGYTRLLFDHLIAIGGS